ncbi:MAG: glycoside hydrolase family 88 protein [Spirochaetaceae bacterium]
MSKKKDTDINAETIKKYIDLVAKRTMAMDFAWDWPAGVAFYGICRAWEVLQEQKYLDFLVNWVDNYLDKGIPKLTVNAVSIGHTLITLHEATGDEKYLNQAKDMAEFLTNDALRFADGVFQHTVSQNYDFPEQAWADTLFMAAYFLVRMGVKTENEAYLKDGLKQYYWHEEFLQNTTTNVYYHAWDNINKNNLSGVYWARANAWATATSAGALTLIDAFNPSFMTILDALRDQLSALVRLQSENGLWHTVLDDPTSYEEVSATAGILAGLIGYEKVLGQSVYREQIDKGINGLIKNIAQDGRAMNVSAGTAVMKSTGDYKLVPKKRIQGWGQGLVLSALAEAYLLSSGDNYDE